MIITEDFIEFKSGKRIKDMTKEELSPLFQEVYNKYIELLSTKIMSKTILKTTALFKPENMNDEEWNLISEEQRTIQSDSAPARIFIESPQDFRITEYYQLTEEPFPTCIIFHSDAMISRRISCSIETLDEIFKQQGFNFI